MDDLDFLVEFVEGGVDEEAGLFLAIDNDLLAKVELALSDYVHLVGDGAFGIHVLAVLKLSSVGVLDQRLDFLEAPVLKEWDVLEEAGFAGEHLVL